MTPANSNTAFDPGLTQQYTGALLRTINKDGSFNVRRRGWRGFGGSIYFNLVCMSWPWFLSVVAVAFLLVNALFATLYVALGPTSLGADDALGMGEFARAFFFSVHTLTTVGYGNLYPVGLPSNTTAAVEAALGLMGFALATGLLFARFSRPSASLVFSDHLLVAPFREGTSLQFRIANRRSNVMINLEADMVLMTVERGADGQLKRQFNALTLERRSVFFLPLTWTIVHPIDESSPLRGLAAADLERLQAEVIILIKGFDDTFSQVVHARYSYRWDEIEWSARFVPAFEIAPEGHMVLDATKISQTISSNAASV
jgi:inward rectifier potassium channel